MGTRQEWNTQDFLRVEIGQASIKITLEGHWYAIIGKYGSTSLVETGQVENGRLYIKKCSNAFHLGMGQIQNSHLYIRYRSSSKKNEAEELKKLTDYFPLLFWS